MLDREALKKKGTEASSSFSERFKFKFFQSLFRAPLSHSLVKYILLGGDGVAARAVELVVATGPAVAVGYRVAESIALRDVLPVLGVLGVLGVL